MYKFQGVSVMATSLEISIKEQQGFVEIQLNGEVDISTVSDLKTKLYEVVDKNNCDVRIDCSNLNYIDSTGLGALVGALKKVKENQKNIYIDNLKSNIRKLFLITGLDKVFIIEE